MHQVRRDFHSRRESNRGHAEPEKSAPEKQNDRTDQDAQNWNGQIHMFNRFEIRIPKQCQSSNVQTTREHLNFMDFGHSDLSDIDIGFQCRGD